MKGWMERDEGFRKYNIGMFKGKVLIVPHCHRICGVGPGVSDLPREVYACPQTTS